jgi:hypothetical protein
MEGWSNGVMVIGKISHFVRDDKKTRTEMPQLFKCHFERSEKSF